ncbi:MAG: HD domain-containing phosphohydrolase [Alcaligenaceae bacterium]
MAHPIALGITLSAAGLLFGDLWSLHFRRIPILHDYLLPTVMLIFSVLSIYFVDSAAFMWVLGAFPFVYMRLRAGVALVLCGLTLTGALVCLIWEWQFNFTLTLRAGLAGTLVIIILYIFFQTYNKLNDELTQTNKLFDSILQSIKQGVIVIGAENRITVFNSQACDLLNLPPSLLSTKPTLPEVVQFQIERGDFIDLGELEPEARAYIISRGINVDEHVKRNYIRKDPSGRYIEVQTNPMPTGEIVRTYTDVSPYENANRKLQALFTEHRALSQILFQKTQTQLLDAMSALALTRDNESSLHLKRTAAYVHSLARSLHHFGRYPEQLSEAKIERITQAVSLHDLGKIGIPDQILFSPFKLTEQEAAVLQNHTTIGANILLVAAGADATPNALFYIAANIAGAHHEHWDGSGYPKKLRGIDIPLEARLMALADAYDLLTAGHTPEANTLTHEAAYAEIVRRSGTQFDPDVVAAFIRAETSFRTVSLELRDGTC